MKSKEKELLFWFYKNFGGNELRNNGTILSQTHSSNIQGKQNFIIF